MIRLPTRFSSDSSVLSHLERTAQGSSSFARWPFLSPVANQLEAKCRLLLQFPTWPCRSFRADWSNKILERIRQKSRADSTVLTRWMMICEIEAATPMSAASASSQTTGTALVRTAAFCNDYWALHWPIKLLVLVRPTRRVSKIAVPTAAQQLNNAVPNLN